MVVMSRPADHRYSQVDVLLFLGGIRFLTLAFSFLDVWYSGVAFLGGAYGVSRDE
jgi:hypothetical protein